MWENVYDVYNVILFDHSCGKISIKIFWKENTKYKAAAFYWIFFGIFRKPYHLDNYINYNNVISLSYTISTLLLILCWFNNLLKPLVQGLHDYELRALFSKFFLNCYKKPAAAATTNPWHWYFYYVPFINGTKAQRG